MRLLEETIPIHRTKAQHNVVAMELSPEKKMQ
jgi:hypothetical protein